MSTGRIIAGRYRLKERLGRGSFGVVWHAEELLAGEPVAHVAVKVFTTDVDRKEISLLAGISHPTILAYRSVVEDDGDVCLVTELADGGDAAARIREWPDGLPADEVRATTRSVATALGHLHEQGWVHRDVKPANILFVRGVAKLGDVGTARALASTAKATTTSSLAYAAPEVFSGKYGPSVDVYALGCTVYELLTGRLPFDGTMTELVHKHLTSDIAFPTDMPPAFVELIRGCTAKEPERRWTVARVLQWADPDGMKRPSAGAAADAGAARAATATASMADAAGAKGTPSPQRERTPASPPPTSQTVTPPTPIAEPARTPRPTPLDPALRRHLRLHGSRWGDSDAWRQFMLTADPTARQHGLSERDLIRRAEQLVPEVTAEQLSDQELIARVGAWVAALRGPRWTASAWADFLDQANAKDEATLAARRDSLIARLYPTGPGARRLLDMGGGVQHLLVYVPMDQLYRPATKLIEAFRAPPNGLAGVWCSAQPILVREWAAIVQQPIPAGTKPENHALAPLAFADTVLATLRRRLPTDELRWPTLLEYDGMKWHREQAAVSTRTRQSAAPRGETPSRRAAGGFAQAVAQATVKALGAMTNEAWLSGFPAGVGGNKNLAMNLVSPVPRIA